MDQHPNLYKYTAQFVGRTPRELYNTPITNQAGAPFEADYRDGPPLPPTFWERSFNNTFFDADYEANNTSKNRFGPLGNSIDTGMQQRLGRRTLMARNSGIQSIPPSIFPQYGMVAPKPVPHSIVVAQEQPPPEITGGVYSSVAPRYIYTGNSALTEYSSEDRGGYPMPVTNSLYGDSTGDVATAALFRGSINEVYSADTQEALAKYGSTAPIIQDYYGPAGIVVRHAPKITFVADQLPLLGIEENYDTGTSEGSQYINYESMGGSDTFHSPARALSRRFRPPRPIARDTAYQYY